MNKKIIAIVLMLVVSSVMISGCKKNEVQNIEKEIEIISVTSEKISTKNIDLTTYAIGKLSPEATYNVVPLTQGNVIETYFEVGDSVKKDDILFILDKDDFNKNKNTQLTQLEISLNQVKINLDDAKDAYEDNKKLYEIESISSSTLNRSKSQYEQAKLQYDNVLSQIKSSNNNLENQEENLIVKSPVDGIIVNKSIENDMFATSQNGYTIIKNNPIIFKAGVSEEYINMIEIGQKTNVFINSIDKEIQGIVKSVSLIKQGNSYPVEIEIINDDLELKPDMYAEVNIKYDVLKDSVVVPTKAITEINGVNYIYAVGEKTENGFNVKRLKIDIIGYDGKYAYIENKEMLNTEIVVEGSSFVNQESIVNIK